MRGTAAVGDGWHVGVVAAVAEETGAVLDVLGVARGHGFRTGRVDVHAGMTYLVVAPAGVASFDVLRDRYDPAVVVVVGGSRGIAGGSRGVGGGSRSIVVTHGGAGPARDAVGAFFSAAGEPAALPGFGGAPQFLVGRGGVGVPPFDPGVTRRGQARAWAVVRGDTVDAAQALRYLIPYLRSRV